MPLPRIALFVPDLSDRPDRRQVVDLANVLQAEGYPVDLVAPTGGGPLRALLSPGIGQIDLARRHTATSILPLARILAERRPAVLAVPGAVVQVGRLARWLARTDARLVTIESPEAAADAIRDATRRSG